ncbi:AKAP7 2'5' RNA ligase-like domain-containing protein [Fomitopsis serialis]|uniref:AKAP7 2'5' RNA ligase-like domain-containing protein n=1 Tax=Fomitopsis serialis TaxID=139415 RepID=UPI002008CB85|nr:AKAP7 2'5' RNA ligase-like domain-containing protein [Neoantrodia serialis]KAH9913435.1 AKAP7 2'5' RNA ligase-like domain-containing protein [Neoantrodia serialis]
MEDKLGHTVTFLAPHSAAVRHNWQRKLKVRATRWASPLATRMLPVFARPLFLPFHIHPLFSPRIALSALARMDTEAAFESAQIGGRGRGRGRGGFRGRGRGRPRGRGRGRGAAAGAGEGGTSEEPYGEVETTASIVEIIETEEIPITEEVEGGAAEEEPAQGQRGRGRRGGRRGYRGWRRGRGRGRGAAPAEDGHTQPGEGEQAEGTREARPPRTKRERPPRPHLTHFISLPIGHHADLQKTISSFTDALLAADPAITGLDPSVVVPARRLHFTLGVMSLQKNANGEQSGATAASDGAEQSSPTQKPTLASAIAHLESLKPDIIELLAGQKLHVELGLMDIIRGGKGSFNRANVMWVGPPEDGEFAEKLWTVAQFVNKSFTSAGFVVDENRPLKLHCTIVNTAHRKPRPKYRTFFSFTSVRASDALRAIALDPDSLTVPVASTADGGSGDAEVAAEVDAAEPAVAEDTTNGHGEAKGKGRPPGQGAKKQEPVRVDLGVWGVDEIQICEMGSHGPEGEYVCVGKIAFD